MLSTFFKKNSLYFQILGVEGKHIHSDIAILISLIKLLILLLSVATNSFVIFLGNTLKTLT